MFSRAFEIASTFVIPIIVSSRAGNGLCSSGIGTATLVNADGWVLTSAHILRGIQLQEESVREWERYRRQMRKLEGDSSPGAQEQRRHLHQTGRPPVDSVQNQSVWWGGDGIEILEVQLDPRSDLALGRLDPFQSEEDQEYPVFKTPGPDYLPGRSLCRIGYALHEFTPVYHEADGRFRFPPGALPVPMFAIEGLFSRVLRAPVPMSKSKMLAKYIETSSPGLRGQSGGPIFDTDGVVWAIQSHTRQYPLGFAPQAPGGYSGHVEHQFLNLGVGVHAESVVNFLTSYGIAHSRTG